MKNAWLPCLLLHACSAGTDSKLFSFAEERGEIDKALREASGLVASAAHPGYFWTHNDSGHEAKVFLIDSQARLSATYKLARVRNRDWEDISLGPGPDTTKTYVYVGDIGDNEARYPVKMIYRFEEPADVTGQYEIDRFDTVFIKLPDGPRDTEALMIDPVTAELFLFSKREDSVRLYGLGPWSSGDTVKARLEIKLPYNNIVAADISADGSEVLLKTYNQIYYWTRTGTQSIPELLKQLPVELSYKPEVQGESIAWGRDGSGYYTLGESNAHKRAQLLFYKRLP